MEGMLNKYFKVVEDSLLKQQVGYVDEIKPMLIKSKGPDVSLGQICKIIIDREKNEYILAEAVSFEKNRLILVPYGDLYGLKTGAKIFSLGSPLKINVGKELLGRILDGLGNPIDGKGSIALLKNCSIYKKNSNPLKRKRITSPISTGIKAIDTFLTIGEGQRIGIFSGAGVGKSTLLGMITKNSEADVHVIGLIGERTREVIDFIEDSLGEEGLKKSVIIVSTVNDPPIVRVKSGYVATTIAEYFQEEGHKVFLMIDSITRLARAQREIGLSIGEMPTTKGYPPSIYSLISSLLERAGLFQSGSITGFYTVLVEGDDINEPVSDNAMSILDGHIILSRKLANQGFYPAINIIESISRLAVNIISKRCHKLIIKFKEILSCYFEYEDLIRIGAYIPGSNPRLDFCIENKEKLDIFLQQGIDENFLMEDSFFELFSLFNEKFNIEEDLPNYRREAKEELIDEKV